jgi:hypothetical protein
MTRNPRLVCPDCGVARPERGIPCRTCGSTDPTQVVETGIVEEIDIALPMGLLAISGSPGDPVYRIQVKTQRWCPGKQADLYRVPG